MTEAEWLTSNNPSSSLEFLREKASERKLRLFACAACRRIWDLLTHPDCFKCIEIGERFADGNATADEMQQAEELAMWAGDDASWRSMQNAAYAWASSAPSQKTGLYSAESAIFELQRVFAEDGIRSEAEMAAQSHFLRDIFGNPFRPVAFHPSWLTPTVVALANGIYADRTFDRMPILADALEEAGCDNVDVLLHCRGDGPHVRGCWVVDGVLGKM